MTLPAIATPLSVTGRWIVDANGRRVKLFGANWAGHFNDMVPCGLDYRHRDDIAAQLAAWGINSVRLTFALKMLSTGAPVPEQLISANPDLIVNGVAPTPWELYLECASSLMAAGIMVIPNCHLMWPGYCCSGADGNGLWWNSNWPASKFFAGWQQVAKAFAADPLVIGYDLKNEPRPATIGGTMLHPTWGSGNTQTDFRLAYEQAGQAIQQISPGKLLFCEGLSYATDLTLAKADPVRRPGVVYSAHDYSWFHASGQSYDAYTAQVGANWGYLATGGTAPVWVGEFGVDPDKPSTLAGGWFANFMQYATDHDLDLCWWHIDGTLNAAAEPTTNVLKAEQGQREAFSLFASDWQGPNSRALMARLAPLAAARLGPGLGV